jgi:hypothetical protein
MVVFYCLLATVSAGTILFVIWSAAGFFWALVSMPAVSSLAVLLAAFIKYRRRSRVHTLEKSSLSFPHKNIELS